MKRVFTPAKKKTVLLVDDDQLTIEACRALLQRRGLQVEVASETDGAMAALVSGNVSLVMLDFCMPGSAGAETLQQIRSKFGAAALPVIAFVNPYLSNVARAAKEAGASKLSSKSDCSLQAIFESVRELLGLTAATDDAFIADADAQAEQTTAAALLNHSQDALAKLRVAHQTLARTADEQLRCRELAELHRQVRSLTAAGFVGFKKISQMTTALEALLIELQAKPKKITPSVVRTVAQAIDALPALFEAARQEQREAATDGKILVVDDEVISRETVCSALEKAKLSGISMSDPLAAQRVLEEEHFDLVFLDVEMPGLTGFELCVKIRETPTNRATPVVFVTSHTDFASRAQSALSGGNDFITKPFLSGELAVKALASLFKKEAPVAVNVRAEILLPRPADAPLAA